MATVAYSIGKASRSDATLNKGSLKVPGPGNYEPSPQKYHKSPTWAIGKGKRSDLASSAGKKIPGPGVYELKSTVGEGPSYAIGTKTDIGLLSGKKKVPGPGAYTPVKVTDVSTSYSMRVKPMREPLSMIVNPESGTHTKYALNKDFTPAPNIYNPEKAHKNLKGGNSFGHEKRKSLGDPNSHKQPGPNLYRSESKFATLKQSPSFGFGTSKRPNTSQPRVAAPGPGAY